MTVVTGVVSLLQTTVETTFTGNLPESTATPWWLPTVGSIGETVVAYNYAEQIVGVLLSPVLLFAVVYWVGTEIDVETRYPSLFRSTLAGFLAGSVVVAGFGVFLLHAGLGDLPPRLLAFLLLSGSVGLLIEMSFVGFAGAVLGHFRTDPTPPDAGASGRPAD